MSPIKFPDSSVLTGQRGDLGLMVWSSQSQRGASSESLGADAPSLEQDPFKPDSFWLESELNASNSLERRFLLAWSKGGCVLGQVAWSAAIANGNAAGCALAGKAFGTGGTLPALSGSRLIERVVRSCEFARILSSSMPCVLSLDRASLNEAHAMAGQDAPARDQLMRISLWQAGLGLGTLALSDHEQAARLAQAAWSAHDPEALVDRQQAGIFSRLPRARR